MITMIIVAVLFVSAIAISCVYCKNHNHQCNHLIIKTAIIAFGFSVVAFLCTEVIIIGSAPFTTKEDKTEIVATQEIIALQDVSSVSGQFFLGSGFVGKTEYYAYYTKTEFGYRKGKPISADNQLTPVYINYISGDAKPHIDQYAIVTYETLTKKPSIWTSIFAYFQYKGIEVGTVLGAVRQSPALLGSVDDPGYRDKFRIEIHVPEGSIKENYEIDLE